MRVLFILVTALFFAACQKENLVLIDPFLDLKPEITHDRESVSLSVRLAKFDYDEVGVYYSNNKSDLLKGASKTSLKLQLSGENYLGSIQSYDGQKMLYYRIYVKGNGETLLSDVYELNPFAYNIFVKSGDKWILPDDDKKFSLTLVGNDLDTDVSQYSLEENLAVDMTIDEIIKNSEGLYEVHITGQLNQYISYYSFGVNLLYKGASIFSKYDLKMAPPPGFGLYNLKKINDKPIHDGTGFTYNNEIYSIGAGVIEKFDWGRNFWYSEKNIGLSYHFSGHHFFVSDDTVVLNGFQVSKGQINVEAKSMSLLTLNLKTLDLSTVTLAVDKLMPTYRSENYVRVYSAGEERYAFFNGSDPDTYEHVQHIYRLDWKRKTVTFISKLTGIDNLEIFEYRGKTYLITNYFTKAIPHLDFYSIAIYEFNKETGALTLAKEFSGTSVRYFTLLKDGDKLLMVGRNRAILQLDLNTFSLTQYFHIVRREETYIPDYLDYDEVGGQIFKVNGKYYFGKGFYTEGLFEFSFQSYDE